MNNLPDDEDAVRIWRNALVIMFFIAALFIFLWAGERWWWR